MPDAMRGYDGYLFDLDGTLVDTAPDINAALNHALHRAGLAPVSEALTRHWVGHGSKVLVQQALDHQLQRHDDLEPLLEDFLRYYASHIADLSRPYPRVIDTLEMLRGRGAKLAVVTNKLTRLSVPLLTALNLTGLFDSIVCGDTAARPKPAADPALYACAALGLSCAETLFVGDSETDVGCARAAGCPVVCVADGYNHGVAPDALGADAIIDSFWDLV
ncbi:MAG: phosphoglycolate phosphatase [Pseudomonadales bacterium]